MTSIDLVNGEVRESRTVRPWQNAGSWSVRVQKSSSIALLVRAKYYDKLEMIAAHSSAIVIDVEGSQLFAAADARTILDQIEGSMAYIDTIGTRAEAARYKEMALCSSRRTVAYTIECIKWDMIIRTALVRTTLKITRETLGE
ncbi:hypothetical protein [Mesorhizobium prunaredense]|nr:hypothetical protein [Mesorhizobium prunaredense]